MPPPKQHSDIPNKHGPFSCIKFRSKVMRIKTALIDRHLNITLFVTFNHRYFACQASLMKLLDLNLNLGCPSLKSIRIETFEFGDKSPWPLFSTIDASRYPKERGQAAPSATASPCGTLEAHLARQKRAAQAPLARLVALDPAQQKHPKRPAEQVECRDETHARQPQVDFRHDTSR